MKSYDELFDNLYNPHLEVVHFVYPIIEDIPDIQSEFAEKLQKDDEKTEKKETKSKIESTEIEPIFTIKDITPKKPFWRK